MVEKLFGDRRITATTQLLQCLDAASCTAMYVVSLDGQFLYAFDPAMEPPQNEEEAVDFVIEVLADVRKQLDRDELKAS